MRKRISCTSLVHLREQFTDTGRSHIVQLYANADMMGMSQELYGFCVPKMNEFWSKKFIYQCFTLKKYIPTQTYTFSQKKFIYKGIFIVQNIKLVEWPFPGSNVEGLLIFASSGESSNLLQGSLFQYLVSCIFQLTGTLIIFVCYNLIYNIKLCLHSVSY